MKVIIAGSRNVSDYDFLVEAIKKSGFDITEVVSGCQKGVDTLGEYWAENHGVLVKRFPADWNRYGMGAGPVRNRLMADYVGSEGGLIAIPRFDSRGTKDMIEVAKERKIPYKVFEYEE